MITSKDPVTTSGSLEAVIAQTHAACGLEVLRVEASEIARFDVDVTLFFAGDVPVARREQLRIVAREAAIRAVPAGFSVAVDCRVEEKP